MEKIGLTITILDGDDNYTPRTGLEQSDFNFVLASDSVTPVSFTGFEESGEGNYNFWGFDVSTGNVYKVVKVKINGVLYRSPAMHPGRP